MRNLVASLLLGDGPARLSAADGAYDIDNERVTIPGTIRLEASDGYALLASHVPVDLETRRLEGSGGARSEESRVGKGCVSTCRSRWSPYLSQKNKSTQRGNKLLVN